MQRLCAGRMIIVVRDVEQSAYLKLISCEVHWIELDREGKAGRKDP